MPICLGSVLMVVHDCLHLFLNLAGWGRYCRGSKLLLILRCSACIWRQLVQMPNLSSWMFMACDCYTATRVLVVISWSYPRWAGCESCYLLSFIAVTLWATWAFLKCSKLLLIVCGGHVWSPLWNSSSRVVACVSRARTSLLLLMGCWILFLFQPLGLMYVHGFHYQPPHFCWLQCSFHLHW